ncbi:phosphoglycerate mutase-like protein [Ramicandelaber brevisporus]|nr:phosphoglycerate mutase-like protein [Ramicandelaber brevisporus]
MTPTSSTSTSKSAAGAPQFSFREKPARPFSASLPEVSVESLKREYPPYLQLAQVQLIHRHGERTPVRPRFVTKNDAVVDGSAGYPAVWQLCQLGNQFHTEMCRLLKLGDRYGAASHDDSERPIPDANGVATAAAATATAVATTKAASNGNGVPAGHEGVERLFKYAREITLSSVDVKNVKAASIRAAIARGPITSASCGYGQLTDVGRESLELLGERLRGLYIDGLGFMPKDAKAASAELYLRSTDYARTVESLHATLSGMYPVESASAIKSRNQAHRGMFPISIRPESSETLYSDWGCRRWTNLYKHYMGRVSNPAIKRDPEFKEVMERLSKAPNGIGDEIATLLRENIKTGTLKLYELMDAMVAAAANGYKIPEGVSVDDVKKAAYFAFKEIHMPSDFGNGDSYRLQSGRALGEMAALMAQKIAEPTVDTTVTANGSNASVKAAKMAIYSGHDITVAALKSGLGAEVEQWPDFASMMAIELIKDTTEVSRINSTPVLAASTAAAKPRPQTFPKDVPSKGYYVRVRENDKIMTLPTCTAAGQHHERLRKETGETMCTLDAFLETIENIVPGDSYRAQCDRVD